MPDIYSIMPTRKHRKTKSRRTRRVTGGWFWSSSTEGEKPVSDAPDAPPKPSFFQGWNIFGKKTAEPTQPAVVQETNAEPQAQPQQLLKGGRRSKSKSKRTQRRHRRT